MGNLLRLILPKDPPKDADFFVDFQNAKPTTEEEETWNSVDTVLVQCQSILDSIQRYAGAAESIREAISNPNDEDKQVKAWEAVCPLVEELKKYFEFRAQLEHVVPVLLSVLCSNEITPLKHLESQQALFKQFAEIIDFVLKFDNIKMTNPSIQNDFSYYRRTLSRKKMANDDDNAEEAVVSNEMANRMSLFYANATPMLKVLSDATTKFVSENKELPLENTTECLCAMADICRVMIENWEREREHASGSEDDENDKMFCVRVMVGVIILYDHVHPVGAFCKNSQIDVKASIKVLQEQKIRGVDVLLNALRYNTVHLNDESTPRSTKQMLIE